MLRIVDFKGLTWSDKSSSDQMVNVLTFEVLEGVWVAYHAWPGLLNGSEMPWGLAAGSWEQGP